MPLAATFVALLALVTTGLALNVSYGRLRHRIPHGEGPNRELARAIRAHMNSVEHLVPLGLLLLCFAGLGGDPMLLRWVGAVAVVARVALTVGILVKGAFMARRLGAWVTYAIELGLVGLVLQEALLGAGS
jgi:uncharacterized membrane protein YecN with MAPEG domain